jgi:hypothetical protein
MPRSGIPPVNIYTYMNKEICFISRPGDGLSYCCFQSEPNPKPMPGMETEWKDNSQKRKARSRHQSKVASVAFCSHLRPRSFV